VVKGVESRQTNVGDFFLIESKCRVRRQSIARRTNGRSGRAGRQRQRPSNSEYRYGFRPTLLLRISLATRHDGGFPFHPHLRVHHTPRTAATQRSNVRHLRRSHPIVRFGSLADILEGLCDVRFTPDSRHRLARRQRQLCAKSGPMRFGTAASVSQQLNKGATTWVAGYFYGCSAFPFRSFLSFGRSAACTVKRHIKMHSNRVGRSNSARAFKCAKCGWSARHTPSADQRDRYIV
jgi:hypothetical protein